MTPEQARGPWQACRGIAAPAVRKLVELLQPLPVRERTTILAQAIHEGAMTRVWADQVLFALALRKRNPPPEKAPLPAE